MWWEDFLFWVQDFEYGKLELPRPSLTFFLDMPPDISQQLLEQNRSLERDLNDYIELSDRLASLKGDITLTGDLIGRLVERIVVYDEQNISVHFKFRDEFGKVVQE